MQVAISILKAVSDQNRLRIIIALAQHRELCACQITELLEVKGATASRHLEILSKSGLLKSRKEGRWVFYRLIKESETHGELLEWIFKTTSQSEQIRHDEKTLTKILNSNPEDICRKQRGEKCCP